MEVMQNKDKITFFSELNDAMRRVYLDGRKPTQKILDDPTYAGYSTGHWEGDTLVVETEDFLPEITFQYGMGKGLPSEGTTAAANIIPLSELAGAARKFPGKVLLTSAILVPLILPPFVGAIGIKHLILPDGAVNSLLALAGLIDPAQPIDWLGESRHV